MNTQKSTKHIIFSVIGIVMIISGILLAVFYTIPQGLMQTLPFVLGSIGFLTFVSGLANSFTARNAKKDKSFAKQLNDLNDERAVSIEDKAKARTHDFTSFLFLAFLVFLSVMQVHLAVLLVFASAFFMRIFVMFYLLHKYNKEM